MSPDSLTPESWASGRARPRPPRWLRWTGPALLGLGAAAAAALALPGTADQSLLAWWILSSALAPERVLPLVGLGVACSLAQPRWAAAALVLFATGIAVGFLAWEPALTLLAILPDAQLHQFRTMPVACLAAGIALVPGAGVRRWLLPPAAVIVGVMLALVIGLTDPSFHDPTIPAAGVLVGLWITVGVWLTVRAFSRPWFATAGRILGSWLIAIGLLYGGASLVPQREAPLLPVAEPGDRAPRPEDPFPDLGQPPPWSIPGPPDPTEAP